MGTGRGSRSETVAGSRISITPRHGRQRIIAGAGKAPRPRISFGRPWRWTGSKALTVSADGTMHRNAIVAVTLPARATRCSLVLKGHMPIVVDRRRLNLAILADDRVWLVLQ